MSTYGGDSIHQGMTANRETNLACCPLHWQGFVAEGIATMLDDILSNSISHSTLGRAQRLSESVQRECTQYDGLSSMNLSVNRFTRGEDAY